MLPVTKCFPWSANTAAQALAGTTCSFGGFSAPHRQEAAPPKQCWPAGPAWAPGAELRPSLATCAGRCWQGSRSCLCHVAAPTIPPCLPGASDISGEEVREGMCQREAYETMILRAIIHPFLIRWSLHHPSAVETWKIDQQYTEGFRELSKHPGVSCSPPVRGCRDLHSLGHLRGAGEANVGLMSSLGFMRSLQKSRPHPLDWKIFGEFPDGTFLRASEREQSANLGLPALE